MSGLKLRIIDMHSMVAFVNVKIVDPQGWCTSLLREIHLILY